jgi:hypothetical protein
LFLFIGCATKNAELIQSDAKIMYTKDAGVFTAPVIGVLDTISPIKYTFSKTYLSSIQSFDSVPTNIINQNEIEIYKKNTMAEFCFVYGCDIVINPYYFLTKNATNDSLIIHLTGYPAKYKDFRQATERDLWMLKYIEAYEK